ncbi:hypothetical protein V2O64_10445 [Verrucomicrobiaceae bacterium 227]
MKTPQFILAGLTAGALTLVSCTPQQQQYGIGGALGGAALGAIAGDDSSDVLKGAAIGGAGGVGVAAYQENRNKQNGAYNTGGDNYRAPAPTTKYPTATRTSEPGVVISPYPPHNKVRVSNLKSGELAKESASSTKYFLVP